MLCVAAQRGSCFATANAQKRGDISLKAAAGMLAWKQGAGRQGKVGAYAGQAPRVEGMATLLIGTGSLRGKRTGFQGVGQSVCVMPGTTFVKSSECRVRDSFGLLAGCTERTGGDGSLLHRDANDELERGCTGVMVHDPGFRLQHPSGQAVSCRAL